MARGVWWMCGALALWSCGEDAAPAVEQGEPVTDGAVTDGAVMGELPDGEALDAALPDAALPDGDLPDGDLPDGDLPDGDLPDGDLPDGDLPDGALPTCVDEGGIGEILRDVAYGDAHPRQVLDLYLTTAPGPSPLIIWIHGGGWQGGDKAGSGTALLPLRSRGYSVAALNYRLSDQPFPAPIADTRAAVRWLRDHADEYDLDPDAFAVAGSSAGGHLVAMLGVASEVEGLDEAEGLPPPTVQAVVDFYGPSLIAEMDADAVANGCGAEALCHGCEGSPESKLLGCRPEDCPERAALASPVTHVSAGSAPFLILHGAEDCTVPTPQSQRLQDALSAAGVPTELVVVPEAGHNVGQVFTPENRQRMEAFLDLHLRRCAAAPSPPVMSGPNPCTAAACPEVAAACEAVEGCGALDACFQRCHGEGQPRGVCVPRCLEAAGQPGAAIVNAHRPMYDCGLAAGCYGP